MLSIHRFRDIYIKYILNNYFFLLAVNAFLCMCGYASIAKFDLLIMFGGLICVISILSKKIALIDLFVILFTFAIAFTSLLKYYPYELWYNGVRYQLLSIIFFIIGKSNFFNNSKIFEKGVIPIFIVGLIGLFLFFSAPDWYVSYKMEAWKHQATDSRILEMTRLSAFWTYPYWISYGASIIYYYLFHKSYLSGFISKYNMILLFILFIIIILAQQRVAIVYIIFVTLFFFIKSLFDKKNTKNINIFFKNTLLYLILLSSILVFSLSFLSEDRISFMFDKLEALFNNDYNHSLIDQRVNIFSDFHSKTITLWGDGIDIYSHKAFSMGKPAITDQQYLKILYETGYFGSFCYAALFSLTLIKGILNLKKCLFELGVVCFFLMAMLGANPLASNDQHSIIFWLCCGRIFYISSHNNKRKHSLYI